MGLEVGGHILEDEPADGAVGLDKGEQADAAAPADHAEGILKEQARFGNRSPRPRIELQGRTGYL